MAFSFVAPSRCRDILIVAAIVLRERNRARGGSGDQIIAAARWSAKGGDGADIGGIATHVFQKQEDGTLKVMLHTFN